VVIRTRSKISPKETASNCSFIRFLHYSYTRRSYEETLLSRRQLRLHFSLSTRHPIFHFGGWDSSCIPWCNVGSDQLIFRLATIVFAAVGYGTSLDPLEYKQNGKSQAQTLMGCLQRKISIDSHKSISSLYPLAGAFEKRDAHTPCRVKGSGRLFPSSPRTWDTQPQAPVVSGSVPERMNMRHTPSCQGFSPLLMVILAP